MQICEAENYDIFSARRKYEKVCAKNDKKLSIILPDAQSIALFSRRITEILIKI